MSILSGLEKFGLSTENTMNLFDEDKIETVTDEDGEKAVNEPTEEDFLLSKMTRCQICEKTYQLKTVKSGRLKRLEPDDDLRPRHQYIDTLKYSVSSCPYCGYTGLTRSINELTSVQRKLIQDNICTKFTGGNVEIDENLTYTYDEAIERYKLALFNSVVKKGKASEKAYICLCISWLIRGKIEQMPSENDMEKQIIANTKKEELLFYDQAYDGFMKAIQTESFPMCGMEQGTVDYLMAVMSYKKGRLDIASKFIQSILTSQAANRRIKEKARELKDQIIEDIKSGKNQA